MAIAVSFKEPEQAKKPANNNNLNIGRPRVAALPARQNGRPIRRIMSSGPPAMPWGMPPSLHSTLGPELKPQMPNPFALGDLIVRQGQQNTQMGNPFFGGAQLPPGLGLLATGMMGQPQNTQMGNPGDDPWSLQIHPKVAEKLKKQPAGLFG